MPEPLDQQLATDPIRRQLQPTAEVAMTPVPQVGIEAFQETAIALSYRYRVPGGGYFETRHAVNEAIFSALTAAGVDILPQREVHLVQAG